MFSEHGVRLIRQDERASGQHATTEQRHQTGCAAWRIFVNF